MAVYWISVFVDVDVFSRLSDRSVVLTSEPHERNVINGICVSRPHRSVLFWHGCSRLGTLELSREKERRSRSGIDRFTDRDLDHTTSRGLHVSVYRYCSVVARTKIGVSQQILTD